MSEALKRSMSRAGVKDESPEDDASDLAAVIRRIRQEKGLPMQVLAARTGIGASTISKIENRQMSPTYDTLLRVAEGLEIDVADLFSAGRKNRVNGRRSITRRGQGAVQETEQYSYEMHSSELSNKHFIPLVTKIKAKTVASFPGFVRHEGEEFIYVLSGTVILFTEYYAPAYLQPGDSCYFDSRMGHYLVSHGDEDATVMWVCSSVQLPLSG